MSALTQLRKPEPRANAPFFEIIDADELAARWKVPKTWIMEGTRSRTVDVIPHLKLGRYVRFRWGSPELEEWLQRRSVTENR
jgi:hypothetical protein